MDLDRLRQPCQTRGWHNLYYMRSYSGDNHSNVRWLHGRGTCLQLEKRHFWMPWCSWSRLFSHYGCHKRQDCNSSMHMINSRDNTTKEECWKCAGRGSASGHWRRDFKYPQNVLSAISKSLITVWLVSTTPVPRIITSKRFQTARKHSTYTSCRTARACRWHRGSTRVVAGQQRHLRLGRPTAIWARVGAKATLVPWASLTVNRPILARRRSLPTLEGQPSITPPPRNSLVVMTLQQTRLHSS